MVNRLVSVNINHVCPNALSGFWCLRWRPEAVLHTLTPSPIKIRGGVRGNAEREDQVDTTAEPVVGSTFDTRLRTAQSRRLDPR